MQIEKKSEEELKKKIAIDFNIQEKEVDDIFDMLSGKKSLLNYKPQEGKNTPREREKLVRLYYKIIREILKGKYSTEFYISEQEDDFKSFKDRINAEEEISRNLIIIGRNHEENWKINEELIEEVYKNIPENLTPEEEAIWVYIKLCKALSYDDKKLFEGINNAVDVNFLESIKPGDKLICFDFARLYAKFVNNIQRGNIEAKVTGAIGHFFVELLGDNMVVKAEAIAAKSKTNDFFKAKMGLPVEGLIPQYDPGQIVEKSIERFMPIICEDRQTISSYINMLETIRQDESRKEEKQDGRELLHKMQALIKTMVKRDINGLEAAMGIRRFTDVGFFGEGIQNTWIRRIVQEENGIAYRSGIIVNMENEEEKFCVFDSYEMEVLELSREELLAGFRERKYEYKDRKQRIKALERDIPSPIQQDGFLYDD